MKPMIGGKSNMIPNSSDLQENNLKDSEDSDPQRKRAASEVSSTSNTSVRDRPPALKFRQTDEQ